MNGIVLDPTVIYSARIRQWVDRAQRRSANIPIIMSATLIARVEADQTDELNDFASAFWLWRDVPQLPPGVLPWGLALAPAPNQSDSELVLRETIGAISEGWLMISKRPDTFFLAAQHGYGVEIRGAKAAERLIVELDQCLGEDLLEALLRRVRFLTMASESMLIVADRGRHAAR